MGELIRVASQEELPPGKAVCVEGGGTRIAVFNVEGTYYALEDTCTHVGGPLSDGECDSESVACPWHGAKFDLRTGEAKSAPASEGVRVFKVVVEGEEIKIEV